MKPVPITFSNVTVSQHQRTAIVSHDVEDYWVGSGFINKKKNTKPRRFLRVRDKHGICKYFFWTIPRRGEMVPVVFGFMKRVKISRQQAKLHYQK